MTTATTDLAARLAAILDLSTKAAPHDPAGNPFAHHTVEQLSHGAGIMKSADQHPARNMAEHGGAGYEMEVARNENLRAGKADKSAARMARMRNQARKKAEFDAIASSEVMPSKERMTQAWRVVFPLVPIVTRIANSKRLWAARFLGSVVDDVSQVVLERMAIVLAKSDKDLKVLRVAADDLGSQAERSGGVPGDQLTDSERADRKQQAKARKWLMGMVNNRVQGTLVDLYTDKHNLRWENLDLISTVMASINGVGDDLMIARHKADRAPAFLGTKFPKPGGIDQALLTTAISAAISDKGLDLMVEILLNEDNREHGGAFRWTRNAERIFLATPGQQGEWLWDLVRKATEHHARPKRARADAARMHVQNQFAWLPDLITDVVNAFDPHFIGWSPRDHRAVLASHFELFYLSDEPEQRQPLVPALRFASPEEAAAALVENLNITTSDDFIAAVNNA